LDFLRVTNSRERIGTFKVKVISPTSLPVLATRHACLAHPAGGTFLRDALGGRVVSRLSIHNHVAKVRMNGDRERLPYEDQSLVLSQRLQLQVSIPLPSH